MKHIIENAIDQILDDGPIYPYQLLSEAAHMLGHVTLSAVQSVWSGMLERGDIELNDDLKVEK